MYKFLFGPVPSRRLGIHRNEVNKYLSVLDAENKIGAEEKKTGAFYQIKQKK